MEVVVSNIIVRGYVEIPNGFKEVEYGECGGDWIPDTFILLDNIESVKWVDGSYLIVCHDGTYSKYQYHCD